MELANNSLPDSVSAMPIVHLDAVVSTPESALEPLSPRPVMVVADSGMRNLMIMQQRPYKEGRRREPFENTWPKGSM